VVPCWRPSGCLAAMSTTWLASIIGGLLAESLAGKYANLKRVIGAYVAFAFFDFVGIFLPAFLLGTEYLLAKGAKYGMTVEAVKEYIGYFTVPTFITLAFLNLLCAFLGALLGIGILKKHFKKAGLI
jgi:energy-coupling factor transport system substrate-specific component